MQTIRNGLLPLLLGALALPAFAQDGGPTPRTPQDPAAGEAAANDGTGKDGDAGGGEERKVDPAALAKLEAWGKAMHLLAHTKVQHVEAKATADNPALFQGGEVAVKTTWSREDGLALDVTLPEAMTRGMAPQMIQMVKGSLQMWAREALAPVFEDPTQYARHYNVGEKTKGDKTTVELLPFGEGASTEMQRLYFDADGLCERRVFIPRVDPNDPSQAMMYGVEIESTYGYEKIGERSVLKRMSMLPQFGEILVDYEYFEVTDGPPLLRKVTMATPFAPDPIEVTLSDYSLDGAAVASTKAQAEPSAEETGSEEPATDEQPDTGDGE